MWITAGNVPRAAGDAGIGRRFRLTCNDSQHNSSDRDNCLGCLIIINGDGATKGRGLGCVQRKCVHTMATRDALSETNLLVEHRLSLTTKSRLLAVVTTLACNQQPSKRSANGFNGRR